MKSIINLDQLQRDQLSNLMKQHDIHYFRKAKGNKEQLLQRLEEFYMPYLRNNKIVRREDLFKEYVPTIQPHIVRPRKKKTVTQPVIPVLPVQPMLPVIQTTLTLDDKNKISKFLNLIQKLANPKQKNISSLVDKIDNMIPEIENMMKQKFLFKNVVKTNIAEFKNIPIFQSRLKRYFKNEYVFN